MKTLIQTSKVLILSIAILTTVSYVQAAWSNPSQEPTGGNTAAPINVSGSNQDKEGGFSAASLLGDKLTAVNEICLGGDCIEAWPNNLNGANNLNGECPDNQVVKGINNGSLVCVDYSGGSSDTLSFQVNGFGPDPDSEFTNGVSVDISYYTGTFDVSFDEEMDNVNYSTNCNMLYSSTGGTGTGPYQFPSIVSNKSISGFELAAAFPPPETTTYGYVSPDALSYYLYSVQCTING